MSLIGPRPELLRYVSQYEGEEKDILQVRPGIYSAFRYSHCAIIKHGFFNLFISKYLY